MGKMFSEKFRDEYKFLEQYGFVFDVDPYNPSRLCYRNDYGEIVLWFKEDNNVIYTQEIYVQINGWKKEINVKEEYKRYINKKTIFKSFSKMFEELFVYFVNKKKKFYGLRVNHNELNTSSNNSNIDLLNEKYDPTKNRIGSYFLYGNIIIIFVFLFLQLGILISYEYIKN